MSKIGYLVEFDDNNGIMENEPQVAPQSKIITKSFSRWYYETQLLESPFRRPAFSHIESEDDNVNNEQAKNLINNYKNKKIENFQFNTRTLGIYTNINQDNINFYILINEPYTTINGYVGYIYDENKYFTIKGIWNHIFSSGLIYSFFINWLFNHHKLILSGNVSTPSGEGLLKKIINHCLNNNIETGIYYTKENKFIPFKKDDDLNIAWTKSSLDKQIYFRSN